MSAGSANAGATIKETCCKASKAVIEYNTTVIKSGGDSQIFFGKFYDEKGNEITDIKPHWDIKCDLSIIDFSDKLQAKETDNSISIGIDDDSCIDEYFNLICSYSNNEGDVISDTLVIKVESLL
mgnify:CR=1 FL=1